MSDLDLDKRALLRARSSPYHTCMAAVRRSRVSVRQFVHPLQVPGQRCSCLAAAH